MLIDESSILDPISTEAAVAAFHAGDRDHALWLCGQILERPDLDLPVVDTCLWLACTLEAWDKAIEAARHAVFLAPRDAQRHSTLSSLLGRVGSYDEAVCYAISASECDASSREFAFSAGALLNHVGDYVRAVTFLARAAKIDASYAEAFYHLAYATSHLGHVEYAILLALRAYRLDEQNRHRAIFTASLCMQVAKFDDAASLLHYAIGACAPDGQLHHTLSFIYMQTGDYQAALTESDEALRLAPDVAEYHHARSDILFRLGRFEDAAEAIEKALLINPLNLNAKRHAVTLYLEGGALKSALATIADLVRIAPDNDEYLSCMEHVLKLRADSTAAAPFSDVIIAKRSAPARPPRPPRTLFDGAKTQGRVIGALFLREMRTRFGESRLGYLWVLIEPIIHMGALAVVFQFTMHGTPPLGNSFFFFYFTGLVPYQLFVHTTGHVGHAILQNKPLLQLPMVTNFDAMTARAALELFTECVVALIFIAGFVMLGVDAIPHDIGDAAAAILTAWLIATGVGMTNAVINVFASAWHHIFSIVLRFLYFCSGIFYVPSLMPEWTREILSWNPMLHCVDWFRTAFFAGYEPRWLDKSYPLLFGIVALFVGFALQFTFRRRLRVPT